MMRLDSVSSVKVWLGLTALVLLAHLLVLGAAATTLKLNLGLRPAQPPRAFSTRSVELIPAQPAVAEPALAAAVARPFKRPSALASSEHVPTPAPNDSLGSIADESPLLPTALEAVDQAAPAQASPYPETLARDELASNAEQLALAPLRPPRESPPPVSAERLPRSAQLNYKVEANKFPYSLNAELVWQLNGQSYDARLAFGAFGQTRVQTSHGQITLEGLAPLRFSDKYRSEVAAHFNREKGKVTFSANTPDVPLLTGAQDRLSVLIQLATMIASAPNQYPSATTIAIQTIGPRDADIWLFTVGSRETLSLPGGELAALKLVRNPRQEFDQRVELWLAPALDYLPARIRITEPNGDFVDQKWLSSEAPG